MVDDEQPTPAHPKWLAPAAVTAVVVLLGGFYALSVTAARTKSLTFDEPIHLVGALAHVRHADWRINNEDPHAWNYWLALALPESVVRLPLDSPLWREMPARYERQWGFSHDTLYSTPGNDAVAIARTARAMMAVIGVALGGLAAWLAWRIGGPVAGVAAAALFALDPNLAGHAPLVKNDVAMSLVYLALAAVCWQVGRRAAWWSVALLGLLCGLALTVKFSGIVAGPVVAVLLLTRALLGRPWVVLGRTLSTRLTRLAAAVGMGVASLVISYAVVWAAYGFRYAATADGTPLNFARLADDVVAYREFGRGRVEPLTPAELAAAPRDLTTRAVLALNDHKLLPEAWLAGYLYTYGHGLSRVMYILGEVRPTGVWYYFPFAVLVKTPLATLAAIGPTAAGAAWFALRRLQTRREHDARRFDGTWAALAVAIPALLYTLAALATPMNIGVRHMLPVYPLLYVAAGVLAARFVRGRSAVDAATEVPAGPASTSVVPRLDPTRVTVVVLLLGALAVESLTAWPHYIAYFNFAAGGSRGGIKLLSDSNLDWGQDLPLLAEWQRQNPGVPLYLAYWATSDPAAYGVRYVNLPRGYAVDAGQGNLGGYQFGPPAPPFDPDRSWGVVAISATHLQGPYLGPQVWSDLRRRLEESDREDSPLLDVLGGTIYLIRLNAPPPGRPAPLPLQ
jgi:hypothetical protein